MAIVAVAILWSIGFTGDAFGDTGSDTAECSTASASAGERFRSWVQAPCDTGAPGVVGIRDRYGRREQPSRMSATLWFERRVEGRWRKIRTSGHDKEAEVQMFRRAVTLRVELTEDSAEMQAYANDYLIRLVAVAKASDVGRTLYRKRFERVLNPDPVADPAPA